MDLLDLIAVIISIAALFSYLNHRFIKLPNTIGVMLIALLFSLLLLAIDALTGGIREPVLAMLNSVDFSETLMQGMLSFLLFAGALHVNIEDLARQKWVIALLATAGILTSTFIIGALSWMLLGLLGFEVALIYCLLFGALISPTDPIAVLGILKKAGVPKTLETKVTGESLFNDGIGVVIFVVLLGIATGKAEASVSSVMLLIGQEALGGVLFGLLLGYVVFRLMQRIDDYSVEVLLTLALVMGGYSAAHALHVSGPIAIVVAGLFIGNHGRLLAMSATTRHRLDNFWELVDEILNAVLFVLIGLEVLVISSGTGYLPLGALLAAAMLAIPLVLLARLVSVGIPVTVMRRFRSFTPNAVRVLTWGGLRGGISVALALSLPVTTGPERDILLVMTYVVVLFSILVQGLTINRLVGSQQ
jgi:CPA1 family monovalent cation:H+ antiporter